MAEVLKIYYWLQLIILFIPWTLVANAVCAAFLDFRKAFDSLDHYVLLNRLFDLNLSPAVLCWFQNYLSHRLHRVKGTNTFSEWRPMRGGIPQGSALGPLLFLVYVNNLPSVITSGLLLQYADDTTLICSAPTIEDVVTKMHCQLMLISQWTTASKMRLNLSKSSVMWFSPSNRGRPAAFPDIVVDDAPLATVNTQKYLGLIFDTTLSWSHQVSKVCRNMSYYLYLLNKHKSVLKTDLLKVLIECLVFSHLNYCLPVWGTSLTQCLSQRLRRMQNRAVRLCKGLRKFDHVTSHFKSLKWLPLEQLIKYRCVRLMHRQFLDTRCIPLSPPLLFGKQHCYATRTSSLFAQLPQYHLSYSQRFFRFKASQWWNSVPEDLLLSGTFPRGLFWYFLCNGDCK